MDVVVVSEHRMVQMPDGTVWNESGPGYNFWRRYLDVFDSAKLVCRVAKRQEDISRLVRVDGPGVTVIQVPYYVGPSAYLRVRGKVRKAVVDAFSPGDAVILRVGSQLATPMVTHLQRTGAPYAVEVVGDPHDVFAPGVVDHPLRPFFRWWFVRQQKRQCAEACAVAYVTEHALQRRYPCGKYTVSVSDVAVHSEPPRDNQVLTMHYSSIELDPFDFSARARLARPLGLRLITVGSLAQLYKGVDTVIRATAEARRQGLDLRLTVVGDGKYRTYLEDLARKEGLNGHVHFTGALPGSQAVKHELDQADLFVLASRTEGLPRALIEAMARGLPCIASAVGGIPELLPAEDMFPPGSPTELLSKITEVIADTARRERMSARNLVKALDFREEILRARRTEFYRHVRRNTEEWSRTHLLKERQAP